MSERHFDIEAAAKVIVINPLKLLLWLFVFKETRYHSSISVMRERKEHGLPLVFKMAASTIVGREREGKRGKRLLVHL